jgi:hypothetical protein
VGIGTSPDRRDWRVHSKDGNEKAQGVNAMDSWPPSLFTFRELGRRTTDELSFTGAWPLLYHKGFRIHLLDIPICIFCHGPVLAASSQQLAERRLLLPFFTMTVKLLGLNLTVRFGRHRVNKNLFRRSTHECFISDVFFTQLAVSGRNSLEEQHRVSLPQAG